MKPGWDTTLYKATIIWLSLTCLGHLYQPALLKLQNDLNRPFEIKKPLLLHLLPIPSEQLILLWGQGSVIVVKTVIEHLFIPHHHLSKP